MVQEHQGALNDGKHITMHGLADVDESKEAVVMANMAGTIVFANKACCTLFGYRKTDLEGKNLSMLM